MALVSYGSSGSSDESNELDKSATNPTPVLDQIAEPKQKKAGLNERLALKRSLPDALSLLGGKRAPPASIETHMDDPTDHAGRVRSFKHERGNWATYVYIAVRLDELEDLQEVCQEALAGTVSDLHAVDDLHMSLSRTVVLQYHHIDSFVESLRNAIEVNASFSISLRHLHIYTNAERTRTFIALKVDEIYFDKILQILLKVDSVMTEYRLQRFYEDPSFHISFLWCLGDKVAVLNENLDTLKSAINVTLGESEAFNLFVQEINCKSGNKEFTFKLN
ncbi:U6 snRNA phosphodiesterase 1 [Anastrepha ludens]|uniref:U6 snRNA phosphodiesterase 1 n=1 Tax=Anastrepha ludens TaxID=28586 RepID=UPI0023B078A3|nr:U6 snRNA phosphodiesterase 1 [Anastrepha ludens]